MNILHLNEWVDLKGGVEVYISQLQELIRAKGDRSFLIGIHEYEGGFSVTFNEGGNGYKTENQKIVFNTLEQFIRDNGIDIINLHSIFNPRLISFCLDRLPVIKFAHGPVMVCPGKDKFWRYSEQPCTIKYGAHCFWHIYSQGCANRHPKRVLKSWNYVNYEVKEASLLYKKIVVMSEYIKDGLLECGVQADKILCNPYFTPVTKDVPEIAQTTKKSLIFIGRLVSSKGAHVLLKYLTDLLKSRDDIHLNIVGDGQMKEQLINFVDEAQLSDRVTFHGWLGREQIDSLLQNGYLVFFPSIYPEAFGIVGIEAMMRGKPVVGFNMGGVKTWLENDITGYLIEPNDAGSFLIKTGLLLDNYEVYSRMAANARKIALKKYTSEIHMKRLYDVYQSAIQ